MDLLLYILLFLFVSCTIKSDTLKKIKTIYLRELTKSVTWTLSRPSCTSVSYIKYYGVATLIPMRLMSAIKTSGGNAGSITFTPYT